jgi:hypothetical protein
MRGAGGHVKSIEQFISAAFKVFMAIIVSMMLGSSYGLLLMSPGLLTGMVVALLLAGLLLYLYSDIKMRLEATNKVLEARPPQTAKEDNGLHSMMVSVLGIELATMMGKNEAVKNILYQDWWIPLVLGAGILFYFTLASGVSYVLSLSSQDQDNRAYYLAMQRSHYKFVLELCAIIPQILITALLMKFVVLEPLMVMSLVVTGPIGIALLCVGVCVATYYYTVQKTLKSFFQYEQEAARREGKVHQKHERYAAINRYVKQFLAQVVVGLTLSTIPALVIVFRPDVYLIFAIFTLLLLASALYLTFQSRAAALQTPTPENRSEPSANLPRGVAPRPQVGPSENPQPETETSQ